MTEINFIVPGNPKGQARPRFARMGKFVRTYDPKESVEWKARVALFAKQAGARPIEGAVEITVVCFVPRPQYLLKKKATEEAFPCITKPDASNILKGIEDALNGIAYADDSQIYSARVSKWYPRKFEEPRTVVQVRAYSPEPIVVQAKHRVLFTEAGVTDPVL